jgi:hypothetical protein
MSHQKLLDALKSAIYLLEYPGSSHLYSWRETKKDIKRVYEQAITPNAPLRIGGFADSQRPPSDEQPRSLGELKVHLNHQFRAYEQRHGEKPCVELLLDFLIWERLQQPMSDNQ